MIRRNVLIIGSGSRRIASELAKSDACRYLISCADNVDEGLLRLSRQAPECVLLDETASSLPSMAPLGSRIRAVYPNLPVVLVSGGDARRALEGAPLPTGGPFRNNLGINGGSAHARDLHHAISAALAEAQSGSPPGVEVHPPC